MGMDGFLLRKHLGEVRSRRMKPPEHSLAGRTSSRDPELLHVTPRKKCGFPKVVPEKQEAKRAYGGLRVPFFVLFFLQSPWHILGALWNICRISGREGGCYELLGSIQINL